MQVPGCSTTNNPADQTFPHIGSRARTECLGASPFWLLPAMSGVSRQRAAAFTFNRYNLRLLLPADCAARKQHLDETIPPLIFSAGFVIFSIACLISPSGRTKAPVWALKKAGKPRLDEAPPLCQDKFTTFFREIQIGSFRVNTSAKRSGHFRNQARLRAFRTGRRVAGGWSAAPADG